MGLLITFVLGLFILIGVFLVKISKNTKLIENLSISVALGCMISLAVSDLLPEIYETFSNKIYLIIIFVVIGVLILKLLDIFIPEYNIAIEYDGEYWHSTANRGAKNGYLKYLKCLDNNISLFTFRDSEWKSKKEIIKSVLVNKFGKSKTNLYARKCEIKLVDKFSKSKFLVDNHLQGKCGSSIDLGLYYENVLVSIMTFGKRRKNMGSSSKDDEYELIRFCTKLNISVIGGASKLLKHFIKNYKPNIIVTFANNRWSDGGLYEKIGFNFSHNSKPSYKYLVNNVLKDRFNYRKDVLVKEGFDESKTEFEIMDERGFPRLYDCGNKVYKLNLVEDDN